MVGLGLTLTISLTGLTKSELWENNKSQKQTSSLQTLKQNCHQDRLCSQGQCKVRVGISGEDQRNKTMCRRRQRKHWKSQRKGAWGQWSGSAPLWITHKLTDTQGHKHSSNWPMVQVTHTHSWLLQDHTQMFIVWSMLGHYEKKQKTPPPRPVKSHLT